MATYYPTPEETAECGYCGYRGNLTEFLLGEDTKDGSECPKCGGIDDSVPLLDDEEIAQEAAETAGGE